MTVFLDIDAGAFCFGYSLSHFLHDRNDLIFGGGERSAGKQGGTTGFMAEGLGPVTDAYLDETIAEVEAMLDWIKLAATDPNYPEQGPKRSKTYLKEHRHWNKHLVDLKWIKFKRICS